MTPPEARLEVVDVGGIGYDACEAEPCADQRAAIAAADEHGQVTVLLDHGRPMARIVPVVPEGGPS